MLDTSRNSKKRLPKRQSPDIPHFLLSHRPEADHMLSHGDADIVISGHTHGGQIRLPFNLLWFEASPEHASPTPNPWHISGGNAYLITKGLGNQHAPPPLQLPSGDLSAGTALTPAALSCRTRRRREKDFSLFLDFSRPWTSMENGSAVFHDDYFHQYQIHPQKERRPVWQRFDPHTGKPKQH